MPQIWVTYEELGDYLRCGAAEARANAILHAWSRRRSRDGRTRVKLDPSIAAGFVREHLDARAVNEIKRLQALVAELQAELCRAEYSETRPRSRGGYEAGPVSALLTA